MKDNVMMIIKFLHDNYIPTMKFINWHSKCNKWSCKYSQYSS